MTPVMTAVTESGCYFKLLAQHRQRGCQQSPSHSSSVSVLASNLLQTGKRSAGRGATCGVIVVVGVGHYRHRREGPISELGHSLVTKRELKAIWLLRAINRPKAPALWQGVESRTLDCPLCRLGRSWWRRHVPCRGLADPQSPSHCFSPGAGKGGVTQSPLLTR